MAEIMTGVTVVSEEVKLRGKVERLERHNRHLIQETGQARADAMVLRMQLEEAEAARDSALMSLAEVQGRLNQLREAFTEIVRGVCNADERGHIDVDRTVLEQHGITY